MSLFKKGMLAGIIACLIMLIVDFILGLILKPDYLYCFLIFGPIQSIPLLVGIAFYSHTYKDGLPRPVFSAYETQDTPELNVSEFLQLLRHAFYLAIPLLIISCLLAFFLCGVEI